MATQRVLVLDSTGLPTELVPNLVSAGSGDSGKLVALSSGGKLDPTLLPSSSGSDTLSVLASEAIAAGAMTNVYSNAGTLNVRNADNSGAARGKICNSFASSAIGSGASGTVTFNRGLISGLTGLTVGATLFLGTTGATSATPPTSSGSLAQVVGVALSATDMQFGPDVNGTIRA